MRNIKTLFALFFTLTLLFSNRYQVKAQSASEKTINQMESDADVYYEDKDFMQSAEIYKKLDSLKPGNAFYNYRIGICYFNSHQRSKALIYFQKCRELNHHEKDVDFYLARTYHLNHEFDNAQKYYKIYKEVVNGDTSDATLRMYKLKPNDLDRMVEMCEVGKKMVQDSIVVQIENMGPDINTIYPDYVPVVTADETVLMFTSRRPTTTGGNIDISDNHYFEDIYEAVKDSASKKWGKPVNMGEKINTKFHDACIGLSPDGQKLFVYRSNTGDNKSGDIYESFLEGKVWSEPIKLTSLNTGFWESSATITSDGKTLYFTSDRPGGLGGTDLYMSKLGDNGQWSDPINLGKTINTPYDEDGPYIHIDGKTLIFSSRGHKTMGGYDIFSAVYDEKTNTWSEPVNFGYPINTADDDIYFVWSADGTKGYFSSWREDSYGEKDLYVVHKPGGSANMIVFKGKVLNKENDKPIAATITVTDVEAAKTLGVYNSNSESGNFAVVLPHGKNYSISVEAEGHMFFSDNYFIEPNGSFFQVEKTIYLESVKVGSSIALRNVFFDFDKATLRNESITELDRVVEFLNMHPLIQVELSGHTDSLGSDAYNMNLSDMRAKAVVQYLTEKGIKKERMTAKGYGETQPLTSNATPEGRQLNRRTQFLITGDSSVATVTFENKPGFEIAYDPIRDGKATPATTTEQSTTTETPKTETKETKSKSDVPAVAENASKSGLPVYKAGDKLKPKVHFTYKQSVYITDFSKQMLDWVVRIMNNNPAMRVRINAYSTGEAGNEVNKALAVKRAETILNYLSEKGIDKSRLETSQATTTEATEKQGEMDIKNRRVDFDVISN